ncbi:hypothetical protein Taro_009729, partial [Colocasia esculenta]|nr:hypothetical protein [Colocasia esculenta]
SLIRPQFGIGTQRRSTAPYCLRPYDVVSGSKILRFALRNCDSSRRSPLFQGFLAVATPSITRIAGGAHMRSRPVTAIGSRVQLDVRSHPQVMDMGARTSPIQSHPPVVDMSARTSPIQSPPPVYSHPFSERIGHNFPHGHRNRLCDHNSESALRDGRQGIGFAEFCSGAKILPAACVLVHRLPYPPVGRGYLFARGSEPPTRPQFRISTSTRSVNGHIRRFPVRRPNSSPGAWSQAANAIAYGHRFAQTCITFRSIIRIAYKTPIRNRHSEALDGPLLPQAIRCHFVRLPRLCESLAEPTCGATQSQRSEVVFNSTRDLILRSWIWVPEHRRYSHPLRFIPTPSAKELGITFRTGIEIAYVTTIRNRHSEMVDKALPTISPIPRFFGSSDSPDYANRWRSPHAEPPSHSDRKSCSTRREISSPANELGITFRTGIGIAYVTTIRNRHSETVDKTLVSRNSVSGRKFSP